MELVYKSTNDPKMPTFLKSYASENEVFIEFNNDNVLYLIGTVDVRVVHGIVEVWGYTLNVNSPVTTLYSSKVHGLISISSVNKQRAIVALHRSYETDRWKMFMNTYMPVFDIFHANQHRLIPPKCIQKLEKHLGCWFDLNNQIPFSNERLMINDQWQHFSDHLLSRSVSKPTRVLVAGYKNSGKSTMMRYFINKCLQKWTRVLVLDFDVGQSEFSIHGCLSAIIIDQPLLGPNLTHLIQPYKSYSFGSNNVMTNIPLYNKIVKQLVNDVNIDAFHQVPCFINTMGFVVGPGLQILYNIISKANPTDVIQVKLVESQDLNLHPDIINNYAQSMLSYELWHFKSVVKNINKFVQRIDKRIARDWMTTSYFSKCLESGDIYFTDVIPYRINIENINIKINNEELSQYDALEKINANIIVLCIENNTDVCECVGFGFVKCVDTFTGDIFVITPVAPHLLVRVNQFRCCSFRLPPLFYDKGLLPFGMLQLPLGIATHICPLPIFPIS